MAGHKTRRPNVMCLARSCTILPRGTFTATGETTARGPVTSCLLSNGKVLINGNDWSDSSSAELYDPDTGTFSLTGTVERRTHTWTPVTASLLTNGKVLVTLWWEHDLPGEAAEVYDPSTGTFTAAGNTAHSRLRGDRRPCFPMERSSWLAAITRNCMIPARAHLAVLAPCSRTRAWAGATLLPDGTVLMSGGWICCGTSATTIATAEIYHPAVLVPAPVLLSLSGDGQGQGAILHAGTYRIASATTPPLREST